MSFFDKTTYSLDDIHDLISNEIEENIHLDYKASGALLKQDNKKNEITKDISSFANSDGGIIVYGLLESDHKPKEITYIDGREITKEWLENVIQSIQPKIENLQIIPIRFGDIAKSIYVVKIPRSEKAPHMAKDNKYYKRYNFKSVPMEDYEVRDLYHRMTTPKLQIEGCSFGISEKNTTRTIYNLRASIRNEGQNVCELYKLNFYLNNTIANFIDITYPINNGNYTIINENRLKLSILSLEPIYPDELLDMGDIKISVPTHIASLFEQKLIVDMILFYNHGQTRLAYIPMKKKFTSNPMEIEQFVCKNKISW